MILAILSLVLLFISLVWQGLLLFRHRASRSSVALIQVLTALALLALVIQRSLQAQFVALLGTFDALIFYALCLVVLTLAYQQQRRLPVHPVLVFWISVLALAFLALASSPLVDSASRPPIPALRSGWLVLHVSLSFVGEALFAFAFFTALVALLTKDESRRKNFSRLTYTGIALGYPIFTFGALICGAVWAESAWGAWWSWDPKETWALITWLLYTVFLHLRYLRKGSDRLLMWVSVIGFLSTLFTFFGVNYLLGGLHSYR